MQFSVCRRWRAISRDSWRFYKYLKHSSSAWGFKSALRHQEVDTYTLRKILKLCGQYLHGIDLSQSSHQLKESTLTIIGNCCPNLQTLDVTTLNISSSGIQSLKVNCRNLLKLRIGLSSSACDNDLSELFMHSGNLRHLHVSSNHFLSGRCLSCLNNTDIQELVLNKCNSLTSTHLCNVRKHTFFLLLKKQIIIYFFCFVSGNSEASDVDVTIAEQLRAVE